MMHKWKLQKVSHITLIHPTDCLGLNGAGQLSVHTCCHLQELSRNHNSKKNNFFHARERYKYIDIYYKFVL